MVRYIFQVIVTIHVFAKYCVIIEAHIGMMQGTQTTTKQTYDFEEIHEKERKNYSWHWNAIISHWTYDRGRNKFGNTNKNDQYIITFGWNRSFFLCLNICLSGTRFEKFYVNMDNYCLLYYYTNDRTTKLQWGQSML